MFSRWALLTTLLRYDRDQAGRDLLAACLVCLLLVPQALAYAQLAGLPAVAGLYASILPLVVYALIGASPGVALSFGPVAVLSLMTAAALAPVAAAGHPLRRHRRRRFYGGILDPAARLLLGLPHHVDRPALLALGTRCCCRNHRRFSSD